MPTPSRLVRVFISSTFRDFIEERDLLVKRVFPELRQRCRKRLLLGICFLREAPERAIGPGRRAGKWGLRNRRLD